MNSHLTVFNAEVRDLTSDGRGVISTPEGETCFVSGVWLGETGQFRLNPKTGKMLTASLVELEKASEYRRKAPCSFHGHSPSHCGACPWQFVSYVAQAHAKQARIEKTLSRLSSSIRFEPIIAAPEEWAYRNRSQLKTDGKVLGYEAGGTNSLVDVNACLVLSEKNADSLQALRAQLPNNSWRSKKARKGQKQKWTTLDIDENTPAHAVSVNQRLPFQQGNSAQNTAMQNWLAKQLSGLNTSSTVLELFCGAGNFTQVIAKYAFDNIIASEIDASAIDELNQKKLPNTQAVNANLYDVKALQAILFRAKEAETLILDPPRDGMKLITSVAQRVKKLKNVMYISCDLATFSRDAKALIEQGFDLEEVQGIDLFPQTPHVEILSRFVKK